MNISTLPTIVTPSSCWGLLFSLGGTGPRGGGQVPTSQTTWAMSGSFVMPSAPRSDREPSVPNFGIHGSSIMMRSYVASFALNAFTSLEYRSAYGASTISSWTPVLVVYIGARAFRPASSTPWTAAIVSFFVPLVVVVEHADARSAIGTSIASHLWSLMLRPPT